MEKDFYRKLIDSLQEAVYFVDRNRVVTYWNAAAEKISGYKAADVIGRSCSENILRHVDGNGNHLCLQGCPLADTMNDGRTHETEVYMHHKDGHRVPVFIRGAPINDDKGTVIGAVEVFSDISKTLHVLEIIKELEQEALQDKLTKLANRRYADTALENHLLSQERDGTAFGLLFFDLDHFKRVNDTWGHNVGDEVLKMAANTIKGGLRPLDLACRWGGEEFVVLIPNITDEGLGIVAERLRMLLENSWIQLDDERIIVTASVGGTISIPGDSVESLVGRADKGVYAAKDAGRNRVVLC